MILILPGRKSHNLKLQAKYQAMEENEVRFEDIECEDAEYLFVALWSLRTYLPESYQTWQGPKE